MKKWFSWRGLEFLLLGLVAAVGLPLAVIDYDYQRPDDRLSAAIEARAAQLGALLPFGNEVRSAHWTVSALRSRPVKNSGAARRLVDDLPRYSVRLAPPLRMDWRAPLPWIWPPSADFDTAGRIRAFEPHRPTLIELKRRNLAWAKDHPDPAEWRSKSDAVYRASASLFELPAQAEACKDSPAADDLEPNYPCYQFKQLGEDCRFYVSPSGPVRLVCQENMGPSAKAEEDGAPVKSGAPEQVVIWIAAILLLFFALIAFMTAFLRRLIKGEWDLRPALRIGLVAAVLILLAWPLPLEWRFGIFGWPLAALFCTALTAVALAVFLGSVRDVSEETAAPIEAVVTRRALTREVLTALAEGALGALALLGACAIIDRALFAAGWAHWPFLPRYDLADSPFSPREWLFALRRSALLFPAVVVWAWFQFRLHMWFLRPAARLLAPLFAGVTAGAVLGIDPALSAVIAIAVAALLFVRRGTSGGMLALLAAAVFWPLAPLAVRIPPFGGGGISAILAALSFLGVFALAIWGRLRAPSLEDGDAYVPDYVRRTREQSRLQRELEIARSVQVRFLPAAAPQIPDLDIAFHCTPAMEVGGDYFDFLPRAGSFDFVVGDVSGKGVASSFYMTLAKGILHTLCRTEGIDPPEIVRRLNAIFHDNSPQGVFLTLAYASLDLHSRAFTYLRAGHNACLVRRAAGGVERLMPPGMIIGFDPGPRFNSGLGSEQVTLQPGDTVVLYTDGVSEAMNGRGEEYGETRLSALVAGEAGDAASVRDAIVRDVTAFCAGERQRDDLTLLICRLR